MSERNPESTRTSNADEKRILELVNMDKIEKYGIISNNTLYPISKKNISIYLMELLERDETIKIVIEGNDNTKSNISIVKIGSICDKLVNIIKAIRCK